MGVVASGCGLKVAPHLDLCNAKLRYGMGSSVVVGAWVAALAALSCCCCMVPIGGLVLCAGSMVLLVDVGNGPG